MKAKRNETKKQQIAATQIAHTHTLAYTFIDLFIPLYSIRIFCRFESKEREREREI